MRSLALSWSLRVEPPLPLRPPLYTAASASSLTKGFSSLNCEFPGIGAQRTPEGETLRRAACNLRPRLDVLPADGLNVYDIVRKRILVLSEGAVQDVVGRLDARIKR